MPNIIYGGLKGDINNILSIDIQKRLLTQFLL